MHQHLRKLLGITLLISGSAFAAFETSVITLSFPPGARATGVAEAFVAIADDASASFFNPAGFGQSPLANTWKSYALPNGPYYALASKQSKELTFEEKIWGASRNGIIKYNGKNWETAETYVIEEGDDLLSIARKRLENPDESATLRAAILIRQQNKIEMNRFKAVSKILSDTLLAGKLPDSIKIEALCEKILELSSLDRDSTEIGKLLSTMNIDSSKVSVAAATIAAALTIPDFEFSKLVEVKIPYTIAFADSITALAYDDADKLWVGTTNGLWKFDGSIWSRLSLVDGLPSLFITTIVISPNNDVGIGTDMGLAVFSKGKWKTYEFDSTNIRGNSVTALAFGKTSQDMYVGTRYGLFQRKNNAWVTFDSANGLLENHVTALLYDSQDRLFVGSIRGISIFNETSWQRFVFPNSKVSSLAETPDKRVWIGTSQGAISFKAGETITDERGKKVQLPPDWKVFHSKNALQGNSITALAISGKNIFIASEKAINQYAVADRQLLFFWENLLPNLKIPDLYHAYVSFVLPTDDWGTFGLNINFITFGENVLTDAEGKIIDNFRSWEGVFGISYGLLYKPNSSFGLNMKWVVSALAPGYDPTNPGAGTGQTFAIDAGLLRRNVLKGLDIGVNFQNMGPAIYYINKEEQNPIPFTIKVGLAYHIAETPINDLKFVFDLNREIAKNYMEAGKHPDPFWRAIGTDLFKKDSASQTNSDKFRSELKEVNINTGFEYWYAGFVALRTGFLFDYIGERYEWTLGVGFKYGPLALDFSYIHSPEGFFAGALRPFVDKTDSHYEGSHGVRDGQPRVSLIVKF